MTESITYAWADARAERFGLARLGRADGRGSALCLLFSGREPSVPVAEGALELPADAPLDDCELAGLRLTRRGVALADALQLEFEPLGEPVDAPALGGMTLREQPCRVRGKAGGRTIDGLGQRTTTAGDPDWEQIELVRSVGAWTGALSAAVTAVRPAGATDHAAERTWATWWEQAAPLQIGDGRISTTYDGEGRMRRAGLELWPVEEDDWPRRGAGEVLCGSTLDLGALRLECSFFTWRLEDRVGVGRYDILRRAG